MNLIDPDRVRADLERGLPSRARWLLHGVPLSFDFTWARSPLERVADSELVDGRVRPEWAEMLVFGESDYADRGGAWSLLCVDPDTGQIHGLDFERTEAPLVLFNSDAGRFIGTFSLFDEVLRREDPNLAALAARAEALDPHVYRASDWRSLVEHLRAGPV